MTTTTRRTHEHRSQEGEARGLQEYVEELVGEHNNPVKDNGKEENVITMNNKNAGDYGRGVQLHI